MSRVLAQRHNILIVVITYNNRGMGTAITAHNIKRFREYLLSHGRLISYTYDILFDGNLVRYIIIIIIKSRAKTAGHD